jgi:hypothetical protein
MSAAWRAWVELLDRREPATALALVRIFVAVALLGDFVQLGSLGLVDALWARPPDGFAWATDAERVGARGLYALAVVALACIAIGLATRPACVVFVLVSAQLAARQPDEGIDVLLRIVVAILALSRCNARWSVDAWIARRRGRPMPAEIPAWPRYLLLFQLVWVYFSAAQNKSGSEWGPHGGFAALGNAMADPHTARFAGAWIGSPIVDAALRVATAATVTFEIVAPLYLLFLYYAATRERAGRVRAWCNRLHLRWSWLALGVAFHLGIAVFLRLGLFPWGMLAVYPVLLLPDDYSRFHRPDRGRNAT